jgi:N-acetylneuraminate synthase
MDYRYKVEFDEKDYAEIDTYAKSKGIDWFVSCWDVGAVDFMEQFNPVTYKIASASLTDHELLKKLVATGRPLIVSTGMSTIEEIEAAISILDLSKTVICHTTSSYPCKPENLNLNMIQTLAAKYPCPIGYSGHEVGLQTTCAAVALGACFVERHITLDRAMWGSDQAASVEPHGLSRLCRDIRVIEKAMGDGVKKVYDEEIPIRAKLRMNS